MIDKSGKELREACKARLNRNELSPTLSTDMLNRLDIMARHLTDKSRYSLTLTECQFLGI
jgi:hypothetical protein